MRLYTIFLMFLTSCVANPLHATPASTYTLSNGLKVIVREDHRAPIVISQVWYKIGSADEYNGITGISHALEHMMFKGTAKYPVGIFSRTIAENGGQENAMTSNDYTVYFQELTNDKLPLSFSLESDRMQNLNLAEAEFSKEIQVVIAERRMRTDDNPQALTYERLLNTAYIASPYHHPVVGWLSDLQQMTANDLRSWYQQWYVPNNATIVVVGDVSPEKVHQLAQQYFEKIPSKTLPIRKLHAETTPLAERRITVQAPANLPWLAIGFNVPSLVTANPAWHAYALEVLASILDQGESSRLPQILIRHEKIASNTDISYDLFARYDELFVITATPTNRKQMNDLENAIKKIIKDVQQKPVSAAELQRAKMRLIADRTYSKDSLMGQAMELGVLSSIGLPLQTGDDYIKQIQMITPEQIQTVAKLYLTTNRSTTALLDPLPTKQLIQQPVNMDKSSYVH